MEIDLTNVGNGHELNEYELSRLKSGHIYQKIKSINENHQFNWIIMSIAVFNILEYHDQFTGDVQDGIDKDGIYYVGVLDEFKCYVDIHSPSNLLTIKYDKQVSRDNKLKSILDGDDIVNEINMDINY